jgi:DNA polymerase-3 subunit gamma/tau
MLTTPAFNALLKTLEEPPEHVKFIFCTTDPEKIPITVLSRCQRFDFAPVELAEIVKRLNYIVGNEGMEADEETLNLLARRANGSMRDSQSLLEQLLSFCTERITVDDVHAMLGTATSGRLQELMSHILNRDAAGALRTTEAAINEGVDVGQLCEQLLGYVRDMMVAVVGCGPDLMRHSSSNDFAAIETHAKDLGLETLLAIVQILDQTLVRMRQSTHARVLLETALVRVCKLGDLQRISDLIAELKSGVSSSSSTDPKPSPQKSGAQQGTSRTSKQKKTEQHANVPEIPREAPSTRLPLTNVNVQTAWQQALAVVEDMTADFARVASSVAISAPNRIVVSFKAGYTLHKEKCERPERRMQLEQALAEVVGDTVHIDFNVLPGEKSESPARKPPPTPRQVMRQLEQEILVRQTMKTFDAEIVRFEPPKRTTGTEPNDPV